MSNRVVRKAKRPWRGIVPTAARIVAIGLVIAAQPILFSITAGCGFHSAGCGDCLQDKAPNSYVCSCQCEPAERHRELRVSFGADDVEQRLDTTILTNSPDLDFLNGRWVGLRFRDVQIPPGSGILHARVQFSAAVSSAAGALTVQIRGVAADNAPVFGTAPNSVSNTPATASSVPWNLPTAWTAGETGPNQLTPDFAPVLQEIIDRPGWTEGNALAILFRGTAGTVLRQAFSQDGRPQAAAVLIIDYLENLSNLVGPQNIPVCMTPQFNVNVGGASPTESDLRADCQGRVEDTLSGLAQACHYPSVCTCNLLVDSQPQFAGKCDDPCAENPVEADCSDFDPVHHNVQATNAPGDAPVCVANSPLSSALFGRRTTCNVTGNAHVDIDDHSANPHTEGVVQFIGDPVPGQSGVVAMEYRLDIDDVTFGNIFHSETFTDLAGLGASLHGSEAELSPSGDGTFAQHTMAASGQGRRGTQRKGLVSSNDDGIDVHVGWGEDPPTCTVNGALLGSTDPEAQRCEDAGPNAGAPCADDGECGGDDPDCSDGVCNCEPVQSSSDVLLSLDVSGEISNRPPTANAGGNQTVECSTAEVTNVVLNATGSSDLDDNLALYSWLRGGRAGTEVGFDPVSTVEQSLGTQTYVLRVIDRVGEADEDSIAVDVVDTTPPVLTCTVAVPVINQTNHNLVTVGLGTTAVDQCEGDLPLTVNVFADEDDEENTGDGHHAPDAKNIAAGSLRLRAERNGNGDGRVYLIIPEATDSSGNRGFSCCTVTVPHDGSRAAQTSATQQAGAARAFCLTNGTAPAGYAVVGDGPEIGNKQ
jgi:hypothetical protein